MSVLETSIAVLVPLLWGLQYVAIKTGLREFPPLAFIALRFAAIALLLIPFVARPTRAQLGPIALISIFLGGLHFGLFYQGMSVGPGTVAAVAYQLATPFIVLLAWLLLGDRPGMTTVLGTLIAVAGVAVLGIGPEARVNTLAILLVGASALAFAVANVLTKKLGPFDPLMLMAWSSLFTIPQLAIGSLVLEGGQLAAFATADLRGWVAFAYTVLIGGVAGFGLWFWLIGRCAMSRIAPFALLLPVFAIISSILFLGEPLTVRLLIGALTTCAGVAMTQNLLRVRLPRVAAGPTRRPLGHREASS